MKCPICNSEMQEKRPEGYLVCPECNYEMDNEKANKIHDDETSLYDNLNSSYLLKTIISFIIMFVLNMVASLVAMPLWAVAVLYIAATIMQLYFIYCLVHAVIYKCIDKYHANTVVKTFQMTKKGIKQSKRAQNKIDKLEEQLRDLTEQLSTLKNAISQTTPPDND